MPFSATDVNDGTIYSLDKVNVLAVYDLEIYRQIKMIDGTIYDVLESFNILSQDVGGGGGAPP